MVSIILGTICVVTTGGVVAHSGTWDSPRSRCSPSPMLVAGSVWVLTLLVAIANIAILYIDLRRCRPLVGAPNPSFDVYAQLAWILDQPAVYAAAVPVLGVAGSIIPVVAKGRQVSHEAMMILIGLAGLLRRRLVPAVFGDERDTLVYIALGVAASTSCSPRLGGNGATLPIAGEAPVGIPPARHDRGALARCAALRRHRRWRSACHRPAYPSAPPPIPACSTSLRSPPSLAALGGWWFWAPKTDGRLFSGIQGSWRHDLPPARWCPARRHRRGSPGSSAPPTLLASADDSLGDAMIVCR